MKTKPETTIEKVIARLERVAEINACSFRYELGYNKSEKEPYAFICRSDWQMQVMFSTGKTIADTFEEAWNSMTEQLINNGYRPVE